MKIGTLRKVLCTLSIGVALLLGMSISTQAQHRHGPPNWAPAYGRRNPRPYGQIVSARRHHLNSIRHALKLRQRDERRVLNTRLRNEREISGNNRVFRSTRKAERRELKIDQRDEREALKDRIKNNGGGNGRGKH